MAWIAVTAESIDKSATKSTPSITSAALATAFALPVLFARWLKRSAIRRASSIDIALTAQGRMRRCTLKKNRKVSNWRTVHWSWLGSILLPSVKCVVFPTYVELDHSRLALCTKPPVLFHISRDFIIRLRFYGKLRRRIVLISSNK